MSEVRNSLQRLVNAIAVLEAAHRAAQLAQQQYEGEQRQFEPGNSSVYLVLQRQIELTNARLRESVPQQTGAKLKPSFDRATASTLERQKIDITTEASRAVSPLR